MKNQNPLRKSIAPVRNSRNRSPWRCGFLPIPLAFTLASLALSPQVRATCQDACLTNNNTVQGDDALIGLTTGTDNTALGFDALSSNSTGNFNTAVGSQALYSTTFGGFNTGIGSNALALNTTGCCNTATGYQTLYNNTTGFSNTATGYDALDFNTTGIANSAYGFDALYSNTTGHYNTATGRGALFTNTTGLQNTAEGFQSLTSNTTGKNNMATGAFALSGNTTGNNNTAAGALALFRNTGNSNIAFGYQAGGSLTTCDNNIDIGNRGVAGEANTIRIGTVGTQTNTYIAGISGVTVAGGVGVIIDSDGHLGTVVSSARFKEAIKPMDEASEAILALKPVTFRYKHDLDPHGIPQFGLVAEDVEKVNPDLVARDEHGKPYSVRYEAVNAMLLNEFLKEHNAFVEEQTKVQEQGATIARLQKTSRSVDC
jgi:hypothetical protein